MGNITLKLIDNGLIKLSDIVDKFASDKIKDTYYKTGKIANHNKNTILQKLARHCEFKELLNNRYRITKIYENPIPAAFNKLNEGFYKYLSPIMLIKLLEEHDETNKILLPLMDYARHIDMINSNYTLLKYNQDSEMVEKELQMEMSHVKDYFEKVDDNIKYYIQRCLEQLEKADVLKWYKIPMVRKKKLSHAVDEKGRIIVECEYEDVRATPEEVSYFNEVFEKLRKELNIQSKTECFYGRKAFDFCIKLTSHLKEKDIMYFYDCYEIYYTSLERCNNLLQLFENHDNQDVLIERFNEKFEEIICNNALKRHTKELEKEIPSKVYEHEKYVANFKTLSQMTIDKGAEKIRLKRKHSSQEEESAIRKMDNEFEIKVLKKCGNRVIEKRI
jgi:hypothetical protein